MIDPCSAAIQTRMLGWLLLTCTVPGGVHGPSKTWPRIRMGHLPRSTHTASPGFNRTPGGTTARASTTVRPWYSLTQTSPGTKRPGPTALLTFARRTS
jgi:hypothetical protein